MSCLPHMAVHATPRHLLPACVRVRMRACKVFKDGRWCMTPLFARNSGTSSNKALVGPVSSLTNASMCPRAPPRTVSLRRLVRCVAARHASTKPEEAHCCAATTVLEHYFTRGQLVSMNWVARHTGVPGTRTWVCVHDVWETASDRMRTVATLYRVRRSRASTILNGAAKHMTHIPWLYAMPLHSQWFARRNRLLARTSALGPPLSWRYVLGSLYLVGYPASTH